MHTTRMLIVAVCVCVAIACDPPARQGSDASAPPTTVVLVRHAEKDSTGEDPGLTSIGVERAAALTHALGEVDIDAVYATQYLRTQATARPLANHLGHDVTTIDAGGTYAADMADLIMDRHKGGVVVVVSHSNTVPQIIEELGVASRPVINEDEYDDLYVVFVQADGRADLLPLRYGSETP